MMAIARIGVVVKSEKKEGITEFHGANIDYLWHYILTNYEKWKSKGVRLLYMTSRHLKNDISLIADTDDGDAFAELLLKYIAPLEQVRGIWFFNLLKPRFFAIPEGTPHGLKRFTVTITAEPKELENIYNSISKLRPTGGVVITYLTYTFQAYGCDIMLSLLAHGFSTIEKFVKKYIEHIEGVISTETTLISRTKRLVTIEEWEKYGSPYFAVPKGIKVEEPEEYDEDWLAGC